MAKLVLIGDSIRMGYAPFVIETLGSEHEIFHPETNGGTSTNVLAHIEEWVAQQKPDVVHVNAGLHDMKRTSEDPHQMVTEKEPPVTEPDEYRENLRKIFTAIRDSGAKGIAVLTTPVIEERQVEIGKNPKRRNVDVDAYNQVMRDVAAEFELPVNDLHSVVKEAGPEEVMTRDGVHFTPDGSKALAAAVVKHINAALA